MNKNYEGGENYIQVKKNITKLNISINVKILNKLQYITINK